MTMARLVCACLFFCILLLSAPLVSADTIRVASFNTELQRDGPGLLLRDIRKGKDPDINAVVDVIIRTHPDILLVQGFDWDFQAVALQAFADKLAQNGPSFPYLYAPQPNSGLATEFDLDGDGRQGGPADAQGFGRFTGQGGIAVLSRFPILTDQTRNFSDLLWRDLPGALLPTHPDGQPFPSDQAQAAQRLSSTGHWLVPVQLPNGPVLTILTFQAGPPVFDGPEDRNGRRNHDEVLLWRGILDGAFGPAPQPPFILAGGSNLDPNDSDGRRTAIRALLDDPRFHDAAPRSNGAATAGPQGHQGDDALDTVDWPRVGRLRVDYVLPSADIQVSDAGVFWPAPGQDGHETALTASRHRLVWADLTFD